MKLPLQITLCNMPHSAAVEAVIREKAEKLDLFYPHIMSCRVTVDIAGKHKHQGRQFNVRIDITVPGSEIVVNRGLNEDIYVALRDSFDAAKRQLEDYGHKQRGDAKTHEPVFRGHVDRLFPELGYGFIKDSEGQELYFSSENLVNADFDHIEEGAEVQFLAEPAAEGMQAKRVSFGKHSTGQ